MELLYKHEHLSCFNYEKKKPMIEMVRIVKGQKGTATTTGNTVLFIMEGRINYAFRNCPTHDGLKGHIIFVSPGHTFSYRALIHARVLVFRAAGAVSLCSNYSVERLYREKGNSNGKDNRQYGDNESKMRGNNGTNTNTNDYEPITKQYGLLEINARLWHFLEGISDCIGDGLKCRCWFEMKIKEFFLMLRAYYPKEQIHDFLYPILSGDTPFSEHIRKHWKDFRTVNELAAFMNMTPKQFSVRFVQVFGKTPYRWMMEGRARIIHEEITSTTKQFKQIAIENGFPSDSLFTRFCKTAFGKTPSRIRENEDTL